VQQILEANSSNVMQLCVLSSRRPRTGFPIDGLDRFASMSSSPLQFVNTHTQPHHPFGKPHNRYMLTVDELLSWQDAVDQHGVAWLRAKRVQRYRQK
jgi:hypothetical protein